MRWIRGGCENYIWAVQSGFSFRVEWRHSPEPTLSLFAHPTVRPVPIGVGAAMPFVGAHVGQRPKETVRVVRSELLPVR